MSVDEEKQQLRRIAKEGRGGWADAAGEGAARRLKENYLRAAEAFSPRPAASDVIAGYWPMADEIDVCGLITRLFEDGHAVALPVVVGKAEPLIFRRWQPGMALEEGAFGTQHPGPGQPEESPGCLIVPLLAFDRRGYRLGWGAGFYDRTLAGLRLTGLVIAVGVAFHAQQVDRVPQTPKDRQLDWIVTDQAVLGPMRQ